MKRSSDGEELGPRVIAVLEAGEFELTAIADRVDEDPGPVFSTIRRLVDEGVARSPRPGVYTLTETARETASTAGGRDG